MNLKPLLTYLLKEDTPDEEERGAPQDSRNSEHPEKVGADGGEGVGAPDEDDVDLEHDNDGIPDADLDNQPDTTARSSHHVLSRVWSFVCPAPASEEEIRAYIPHYRILPILSGIIIPFSILLEVPGLTEDWYIRFEGSTVVASKSNSPLLDVGIGLSILCAILANVCLVVRFLEKRIKTMTILCTLFLSIHDIINIVALATFGATKGDYTYSHAFWMTLCSTIVSMFTNVTLIIDLIRTPDFRRSGSGLTRTQRSSVIIIIGLFCYIALGALINSLLLDLTFIDGLYFTVVTIETIGFGDIIPDSTGSRIFVCFYATLGVINLAFVVGYVRESVMEGLDFGYRRRLLAIQEMRRVAHRRRRAEKRWRHAIIWRLRERNTPVWIPKETRERKSVWSVLASCLWRAVRSVRSTARRSTDQSHRQHGMQLNLWALPPCQLEAAALEAGCTLDTFLPADFYGAYDQGACYHTSGVRHHALPPWFMLHSVYYREHRNEPLTHRRLGAMTAILTKQSLAVYESGGNPLPHGHGAQDTPGASGPEAAVDSSGSLQTSSSEGGGSYRRDVEVVEKKAYYTRFSLSWGWFLIFWMGGAAIFKATEGWSYGLAVYFCFISFSTIGYGDLVPTTPAGRSIFVVWALIGVATMTIFISVVSEAYNSRYKGILGRNSFNQFVRQYRKRKKAELSEKEQHIGTSTEVKFHHSSERDVVQGEPPSSSAAANDTTAFAVTSASTFDQHVQNTQRTLETLPRQVLAETQSIKRYMQLINEFDGRSIEANQFVGETVWSLVDDIMGGRQLTEEAKKDILKDGESRQTLMLLGIERSLKALVDISEQAIETIYERDRVIATSEGGDEQDGVELAA